MARRVGTGVAVVLALVLGAILLWPDGWAVNRLVVRLYLVLLDLGVPAAVTPEHYAALLNVLAFVPLGWLGVAALRRRPWVVVGTLAAASVLVETAQLWPGLRREASLVDVVCNVAGAAVGVLAASVVAGRARRAEGLEDPGGDEVLDEAGDRHGDRPG